jgi:hypothetical protein
MNGEMGSNLLLLVGKGSEIAILHSRLPDYFDGLAGQGSSRGHFAFSTILLFAEVIETL